MSIMSYVVSQFREPRGAAGRLAGWIMASRPSNRKRNFWTVDLLNLETNHRVLEIGFGPRIALERVVEQAGDGAIVGIDHSELMLRQAAVRNREAIDSGRLRLTTGTAEELAGDLGTFDRIYSVNVVQFWRDPGQVFASLLPRLNPGGIVATAYQPRHRNARPGDADRMANRIEAWMAAAGFADVRSERLELRPIPVVCMLGRHPMEHGA